LNDPDPLLSNLFHPQVVHHVLASSTERVHCFESSGDDGGSLVWESDEMHPATAPVVGGDQVYVLASDGRIYELSLEDGHVLQDWTFALQGEPGNWLGYSDGLLVFRTGYSDLYGFHPATQQQPWHRDIAFNPPVVGAGGRVYCADGWGTLHAVTSSGADAWTYGGPYNSNSPGAGTNIYRNPLPSGQWVYAKVLGSFWEDVIRLTSSGHFSGKATQPEGYWNTGGYAIGPSVTEVIYEDAYEFNFETGVMRGWLYAFDFNGNTVWESPPVEPGTHWLYTDPVLDYSRLFVASLGGDANYRLYAFDITSGLKVWQSEVPIGADWDNLSDIVVECDGGPNVFIASQSGYLFAFSRTDGKLAWKAELQAGAGIDWYPRNPTSWCHTSWPHLPNVPNAIDPLALILPGWLYAAIHKPYPLPDKNLVRRIQALTQGMPLEDKQRIRSRARVIGAYAELIDQAFGGDAGTQD